MSEHWNDVYANKPAHEVSWFQRDPEVSVRLIERTRGSIVDVGAGASVLVDRLITSGRTDLTLLDVSETALNATRRRLGNLATQIDFVADDVCRWQPDRSFDCWHDRATFHFLTTSTDQHAYVATATAHINPSGALVLGCFASDGPTQCSGLPTARYEASDLADIFADGFTLEHSEKETHETPWSAPQQFTWVILRRRNAVT